MKDGTGATPRILLVGSSGFIGQALQRLYRAEPNAPNISTLDIVRDTASDNHVLADLSTAAFNEYDALANRFDTIFNLAAVHRDDVKPVTKYFDVNVRGAERICELARQSDTKRIVFTSSVAIYGFAAPETDEQGEPAPFNEYGRTKALAENVYRQWLDEDPKRRSLVIVRPTVVFGPGNRGNVYSLLNQIVRGPFVMIGRGNNKKSMAYVENVAAFLKHIQFADPGLHIYNYVDKPDMSMSDLVRFVFLNSPGAHRSYTTLPISLGYAIGALGSLLGMITRRSVPLTLIRVRKFCATTQFASSAYKTGFVPPVPLDEALRKTIQYEFGDDQLGGLLTEDRDQSLA